MTWTGQESLPLLSDSDNLFYIALSDSGGLLSTTQRNFRRTLISMTSVIRQT